MFFSPIPKGVHNNLVSSLLLPPNHALLETIPRRRSPLSPPHFHYASEHQPKPPNNLLFPNNTVFKSFDSNDAFLRTQKIRPLGADKNTPGMFTNLKATELTNGAWVLTLDSGKMWSGFGVYIPTGPVNETEETRGCSIAFEHAANMYLEMGLGLDRIQCASRGGVISFTGSFLRSSMIPNLRKFLFEGLDVFLDRPPTAVHSDLHVVEGRELWKSLFAESEHLEEVFERTKLHNSLQLLDELAHLAMWSGQPMGSTNHFHYSSLRGQDVPECNRVASFETFSKFIEETLRPSTFVYVGMDVDHDEFVRLAETHASSNSSASSMQCSPSHLNPSLPKYVHKSGRFTPNTIGFSTRGLSDKYTGLVGFDTSEFEQSPSPSHVPAEVIEALMLRCILGGGESFSTGGPGKGLFSRLYRHVLPIRGVDMCMSFFNRYWGNSVWGVTFQCDPDCSQTLYNAILQEVMSLSRLTVSEFERCKRKLLFMLWSELEKSEVVCEELGRQAVMRKGCLTSKQFVDCESWVTRPEQIESLILNETRTGLEKFASRLVVQPKSIIIIS